jgi:hypothetical protein
MNRLSTVATGGFDVNLNPLDPSQAIVLDVRAYDGAGRLVRNGPAGTAAGSLPAAYIAALNAGGQSDANGAISRINLPREPLRRQRPPDGPARHQGRRQL